MKRSASSSASDRTRITPVVPFPPSQRRWGWDHLRALGQAWSRVEVITMASENPAANVSTVPKIAPIRSAYLAAYSGTWSAGGWPVAQTGGALDADDVAADVGDVEPESDVRVGGDVAELGLARPAVDQHAVVVAIQEPHGNGVRPACRIHGREPGHQVGLQPSLHARASIWRKGCGQFHVGHLRLPGRRGQSRLLKGEVVDGFAELVFDQGHAETRFVCLRDDVTPVLRHGPSDVR